MSVSCQSNGTAAVITPLTPPMTNSAMKPSMNFIAAGYHGRPSHSVASHENTATALGIVMKMLAAAEEGERQRRDARGEHVVQPHAEAEHRRSSTVASATNV